MHPKHAEDLRAARRILKALTIGKDAYSLRPHKKTRLVTIRHQQTRACNLMWALSVRHGPKLRARRILIIGAGVAGVTAAAFARRLGVKRISIVERLEVPMWNLQHGHTRWLHPFRFLWPEEGFDQERMMLPVCNWTAGYAHDVHDQISASIRPLGITPRTDIADFELTRTDDGFSLVPSAHGKNPITGDVLICADGLGLEAQDPSAVNSSYWLDDNVHREEIALGTVVRRPAKDR